ncbi:MAG: type I DNA topoisomerase [Tissierellia bacterium]|nr:type I DNA topoisomerase [Tissierellia bacterium]
MARKLVIVESPTKAKTIRKILGSNYKVVASVGHIRDLPKSRMAIDIENNFEPEYINIRGKGPIIKELKKEAKKAKEVYLATDPDREGEAISWHLAHILDLDENENNRIVFNEITKDSVKEAAKNPRKIDLNLVDAQQGRRILDRLVGFSLSPLLWKKVKNGLSAGRVQSAALKLICDREKEIEDFIPEEYWSIDVDLEKDGAKFNAKYYGELEGQKEKKVDLKTKDDAKKVEAKTDPKNYIVKSTKKGSRKRMPKPPFTTSTMQQEAARYLRMPGRKTMSVAQGLYEGVTLGKKGSQGLITYMRTDSIRVSDTAKKASAKYISDRFDKNYVNTNHKFKGGKKSQDAHECIRPTDIFNTPEKIKEYLDKDQYRLYKLIWERFVASMMTAAAYDTYTATIISNDQLFKANGENLKFDGFLALKRKEDEEEKAQIIPQLKTDDRLNLKKFNKNQHFTTPPPRFNEASLIKTLEELNIGRPSTYSSIVGTILSRGYVQLEERRFFPTELGTTVNTMLEDYFGKLIDAKFTAKLEDELDDIAEGKNEWRKVVKDFYKDFEKDLKIADEEISKIKIRDPITDVKCDKCGRNMVIKLGRYGKFLACPGFPECKNAMPLENKIGVKCPKCSGDIVEKRSKKGRVFYGCNKYPKCDFVSWKKPVAKNCPLCKSIMLEKDRRGESLICSNPECKYQEKIK